MPFTSESLKNLWKDPEFRAKMIAKRMGHPVSEETRKKISLKVRGRPSWNKGGNISEAQKEALRVSRLGAGNPMWGKKTSEETKAKLRAALTEQRKGAGNPNWKGGVTPINKKIRRSAEFRAWREAVFNRDNYTCVFCGARGGEIHPDHIKQFAHYPELRFEVSNGRTLCRPCHEKTPTWGSRKKHV